MSSIASSPRVLLTGAGGFIGRHMQQALSTRAMDYRLAVRRLGEQHDSRSFAVGDIGPHTDWRAALDGMDVVVHLAARAHVLRETAADPRAEFMRVNADGTAALAEAAIAAGLRRLVYVSSIGVHGSTSGDAPITADSPLHPHNAYTESKLAGEIAARSAGGTRLEVVVLRVPLVYGSGVGANFFRLMRWVDRDWPIPLGAVDNRRSLVNVWSLCDLLLSLLVHRAAPSRAWVVSDGEDLSTPELVRRIAGAMRRSAKLVCIPVGLLRAGAAMIGRSAEFAALCGSLVVDMTQTRRDLAWAPRVSVREGVQRTVDWYLTGNRPHAA